MATGRYVPPGARRKETTVGPSKNSQELQRPLAELVHDAGGDVFTVELRSNTHYGKYTSKHFIITINHYMTSSVSGQYELNLML